MKSIPRTSSCWTHAGSWIICCSQWPTAKCSAILSRISHPWQFLKSYVGIADLLHNMLDPFIYSSWIKVFILSFIIRHINFKMIHIMVKFRDSLLTGWLLSTLGHVTSTWKNWLASFFLDQCRTICTRKTGETPRILVIRWRFSWGSALQVTSRGWQYMAWSWWTPLAPSQAPHPPTPPPNQPTKQRWEDPISN